METNNDFTVIVDYNQTIEQMIETGKYDGIVNADIIGSNFPMPTEVFGQKISVSGRLFQFSDSDGIFRDYVISQMEKEGYRPATLPELLALGNHLPDLQKISPIVALGSIWSNYGVARVPNLRFDFKMRGIDLNWLERGWTGGYCFFGIRK